MLPRAASGIEPRLMPATRFTVSFVVTLEGLTLATFAAVVAPQLRDQWRTSMLTLALGSAAFYLHFR